MFPFFQNWAATEYSKDKNGRWYIFKNNWTTRPSNMNFVFHVTYDSDKPPTGVCAIMTGDNPKPPATQKPNPITTDTTTQQATTQPQTTKHAVTTKKPTTNPPTTKQPTTNPPTTTKPTTNPPTTRKPTTTQQSTSQSTQSLTTTKSPGKITNYYNYNTLLSICVSNPNLFIPYIYKCHINLYIFNDCEVLFLFILDMSIRKVIQ